jgi:hypothetical protein
MPSTLLLLVALAAALVQPPAHPAAAPETRFLGTWEGTFSSHGPSGTMRLVVARDTTPTRALKASLAMTSAQPFEVGTPTGLRVAGNELSWTQPVAQMECKAVAVLDAAGALRGEMACGHGALDFVMQQKK